MGQALCLLQQQTLVPGGERLEPEAAECLPLVAAAAAGLLAGGHVDPVGVNVLARLLNETDAALTELTGFEEAAHDAEVAELQ